MKLHFIQDWGTYKNDTLVVIGMSREEIIRLLGKYSKKNSDNKDILEDFKKNVTEDHHTNPKGYFYHSGPRSLLYLREWENDWENYETLIHELHHAVFYILGKERAMPEEVEALAYQQEYLFHAIRRRLQRVPTKRRKKKKV